MRNTLEVVRCTDGMPAAQQRGVHEVELCAGANDHREITGPHRAWGGSAARLQERAAVEQRGDLSHDIAGDHLAGGVDGGAPR